jgi:LmbE family N-acetylglucosaminyl deacetylase
VLSPHCDDETLGLGGTIAQARRNGVPVTVAFLTNGDGFPLAAGRELRDVRLTPADYVRFAERRQQETLRALSALGVDKSSAVFLSYPDRGLIPLWETNWSAAHPYTSRYTGRTHIPYRRAFRPGAPHAGESLLADLTRLMATVRPSDIYVTHPDDDHPDHAASAAFAQAALLQARDAGAPWAREARLRYYLVHRGDWPLPQGRRPNKPLLPPAGLRNVDTRWEVLPLDVRARAAKERALRCYGSQMAVMSRFLLSFVRENELQGVLPESADAASAISPEPLEDDVVRFAGPSADVSAVAMTQDADGALRVRMIMRGPISPRVSYTIRLRAQTKNSSGAAASEFVALDLALPSRAGSRQRRLDPSNGIAAAAQPWPNTLEVRIPRNRLSGRDGGGAGTQFRRVWLSAETRLMRRIPVDRTGYHLYTFAPAQQEQRRAALAN